MIVSNGLIKVLTTFQGWQIQYFGSTNDPAAVSSADSDGDGQDNLTEFLAGTDPTNSASAFRINSITAEGDDVAINWTMGSGRTNALQFTPTDPGSGYADLFIVTNTVGAFTNYTDFGAATNVPSRF